MVRHEIGAEMRSYLLSAATIALLLVPIAASAQQSADPCYDDPTSDECLGADDGADDDIGADDAGADDDIGADDAGADDGDEVDTEVLGETLTRGGAVATTGTDLGVLAAIVVALLAAGGILLALTKRRGSAA